MICLQKKAPVHKVNAREARLKHATNSKSYNNAHLSRNINTAHSSHNRQAVYFNNYSDSVRFNYKINAKSNANSTTHSSTDRYLPKNDTNEYVTGAEVDRTMRVVENAKRQKMDENPVCFSFYYFINLKLLKSILIYKNFTTFLYFYYKHLTKYYFK